MTTVTTTQQFQQALRQGVDPRAIKIGHRAAADAENAATQAERQRCKSIIELTGDRYRAEARRAIETGMTLEALGLELHNKMQGQGKAGAYAAVDPDNRKAAVSAITSAWRD